MVNLNERQLALLKEMVEVAVECEFDCNFGLQDEDEILTKIRELVELNQILCTAAGYEETSSELYTTAKETALRNLP